MGSLFSSPQFELLTIRDPKVDHLKMPVSKFQSREGMLTDSGKGFAESQRTNPQGQEDSASGLEGLGALENSLCQSRQEEAGPPSEPTLKFLPFFEHLLPPGLARALV